LKWPASIARHVIKAISTLHSTLPRPPRLGAGELERKSSPPRRSASFGALWFHGCCYLVSPSQPWWIQTSSDSMTPSY